MSSTLSSEVNEGKAVIFDTENVRDIFSIFHDGVMNSCELIGDSVKIRVEISYLARLVSQSFEFFDVTLVGVKNVSFLAWPSALDESPWVIYKLNEIFRSSLEILSAENDGEAIKVVCNQTSSCLSYCGGELCFSCNQAIVQDPLGFEYSIDQLDVLCKKYWDDWARKRS